VNATRDDCYDCATAQRELDAFVRGDLPVEEAERMKEHLDRCGHCAEVTQYEQAFRDRLRRIGSGGCCPDVLRERIRDLLAREGPDERAL
jgi:anti-sigma factor (TIGR02949 family)